MKKCVLRGNLFFNELQENNMKLSNFFFFLLFVTKRFLLYTVYVWFALETFADTFFQVISNVELQRKYITLGEIIVYANCGW